MIDYQSHLQKLGTMTASTYAFTFTVHEIQALYDKMLNEIEKKKDFSRLGPMHQLLCGIKALFCKENYEFIKVARELCGDEGYHSFGGIHKILD